jgi:TM2 domain-containing membrane protein YozV
MGGFFVSGGSMSTVNIVCPDCGFGKEVAREKIPAGKIKVNCPECQAKFPFTLTDASSEFRADEPSSATAAAKPRQISKVALLLFTFFLGGVGAHKFYLHKYLQGVLYLVFCWTAIPSLIAFIEFILYIFKSEEDLQAKYG